MRSVVLVAILALLTSVHLAVAASVTQTDNFNADGVSGGGLVAGSSLTLDGEDTAMLGANSIDFNREVGITFADLDGSSTLESYGDHDGGDFSATHECISGVPGSGSYISPDSTLFDLSGSEESVLPQGNFIGSNADLTGLEEVRFLVTGTHHCDSSQIQEASYTVSVNYQAGDDQVEVIPVPVDSGLYFEGVVDSDDGDAICDASDNWCLFATGDTGDSCDCGDGDHCNLFEILVLVDSTGEVDDLEITWPEYFEASCSSGDHGLEGPLAITVLTETDAYLQAYDVYGSYDLLTSAIGAPSTALWTGVSWSATSGGEPEGYRITDFSCGATGDEATSTGWSGLPWTPGENPAAPTDDIEGVEPYDFCRGRFLTYSVEMIDSADTSQTASIDSLTFHYELDVDGDGYGNEGLDGERLKDCDDGNPGVAQLTWYADCDDDGVSSSVTCQEWLACTANEAFANCTVQACNGGSSSIPESGGRWLSMVGDDCDDDDPAIQDTADWFADCDGDGLTSSSTTCLGACSPGNECPTACAGFPAFAWSTNDDLDCDDSEPEATVLDCSGVCGGSDTSCELFADGFESGDTSGWNEEAGL